MLAPFARDALATGQHRQPGEEVVTERSIGEESRCFAWWRGDERQRRREEQEED